MKKLLSIVATLMMISVAFTSCKDANEVAINQLIGKWSCKSIQVIEKVNGEERSYTSDCSNEGLYYEFFSDGKFVFLGYGNQDSGSWTLAQNKLTLKRSSTVDFSEIWSVNELTASTMILETDSSYSEDGETIPVHYICSFTKVR